MTTNITAFPSNLKDLTRKEYEDFIKNYGDVIQKELYEIVKRIKNKKKKFGAVLICSDTSEQRLEEKHTFKFKKSYQKILLKVIKIV